MSRIPRTGRRLTMSARRAAGSPRRPRIRSRQQTAPARTNTPWWPSVVPADRGDPIPDLRRLARQLAGGATRRVAGRPEHVEQAVQTRPRLGHLPDRGPAGPRAAAPTAADEAGHRPLVSHQHRPRTHPLPAGPAHRGLLPGRPPPARRPDPFAAAVRTAAAPGQRHRQPATRASQRTRRWGAGRGGRQIGSE